ncbi:predicted protein [Naegleria gruberi]|uniref:Glucosamine 6-phosphate N-acetyltransferase n=1 Tax=Naegleria gruberi TaxID=5762 RepID=D2VY18_NAEGR|nr:uncharacterized protein NAEGRDRAFT_81661 [Naegleria gruberi]EFC38287.1 predicted protein [Naegleria gruberi]|eukprot:XP_002671031.1 predicted protein [Naegleria gruberi strain NEG-M]
MNLKECFSSLTMQTVMLLQIQDLTEYYQEKRRWMVENMEYSSIPIFSGRKICENEKKSFELVEMKSPEEMVQFWTCQSDAFSGVPQISDNLKEIIRNDTSTVAPDSSVKSFTVGIKQKLSNGQVEIVACGKLVMGKHVASINHLATRDGHRNQGFATILMVSMIDMAKQLGYTKMVLEATEMGIGIYEKFGFKPVYDFYIFELDHKH